MQNITSPQLLTCLNINNNEDHLDRYLFQNNKVKYIKVKANAYTSPHLDDRLPSVPEGDWNWGIVDRDRRTGDLYFRNTTTKQLQGVTRRWHADSFDHWNLCLYSGERRNSKIYMPTQRHASGRLIVVKMARLEHEIRQIKKECDIYERIKTSGIAPEFLGFVNEEDRIIGFAIERIESAREPMKVDVDKCEAVLRQLHHLGIAHGDCHKGNFLIKDDRAWLIDFESSESTSDPCAFARDVERLRFEVQGWK
jgi:predicted Ser/Thr protein kinase